MSDVEPATTRPRWQRSQRFQLSTSGREAGAGYRAAIVASRGEGGRRSFDAACSEWAVKLNLEPGDGLYLGELQAGPRTISELTAALDGCGPQPSEIRGVVTRLVKLQLLEPVAAPIPPPPAPRRW